MAAIYLIRHGQASFNSDNYDQLSPTGMQQSEQLGIALKQRGIQFDAAYMGTMRRHHQTAEGCLGAMDCSLQPDIIPNLNEYDHDDVLHRYRPEFADRNNVTAFLQSEPQPRKAFQRVFQEAVHRWRSGHHDSDYNETWTAFQARCIDALNQIRNQTTGKSIAVFSSGGPISAAVGHCLELTDTHIAELSWSLLNCSVSGLLFNQDKMTLRFFNDYSHFENADDTSLLTFR